jgi:hypothetical protein
MRLINSQILVALSFLVVGSSAASSPWWSLLTDTLDLFLLTKPDLAKRSVHRVLEFGEFDEGGDKICWRGGSQDRCLSPAVVNVPGDFNEVPDACPATTTCPAVCVANETECPTSDCEEGLTLCVTGNCEVDCTYHDEELESPCACDDLPVACLKVVDFYPVCFERFQEFYDSNTACVDAQEEAIPLLSFTSPWFLVCYFGISVVTVLVVVWCFFNQKIFPVPSSTMSMEAANDVSSGAWSQTGYKRDIIGYLIYALVLLTFVTIQFLLFLLTIFYYMQQEAITKWAPIFYDEVQVLKAFEIVWMVGFVWCMAFRYPSSVHDLFLRRCDLSRATHVAVVAPIKSIDVTEVAGVGDRFADMLWSYFDCFLRAVFSYPYGHPGMETVFCPIGNDMATGMRSILHRMRRYVYDNEKGCFVPCYTSVGTTLGEFLDQVGGLSLHEASHRRGRLGPNVIPMPKPTILGSIYKEFSKTFYLYQNFMVWSWAPFWYYYMALVNSFVRVTSGLVVAVFQYMSDSVLYQLSHVEGELE